MKLKAVIFDLDGTVLDNEDVYSKAFNHVLSELGVDTSIPIPHTPGIGLQANWENLIKKLNIDTKFDVEQLSAQTQAEYQKHLGEVRLREGFTILAAELQRNQAKLALATSNSRDMTSRVLDRFFITKYFEAVVTIDEVHHPKPHPEIFLVAAAKLNVDPINSVVIEDAKSGIEAAKKAGMSVVWLSSESGTCGEDLKARYFYELNFQNIKDLI